MKKYLIIIFTLFAVQNFAQEAEEPIENLTENKVNMQAIEALKTAFITKELNLSPDEAQKFWPIYYNYIIELKKNRQENRNDVIVCEEKKVAILKKYREDFKRILNNDDRVKRCFNAAPEFNKLLHKEWKRRQEMKHGGGMPNNKNGMIGKGFGGDKNKKNMPHPH